MDFDPKLLIELGEDVPRTSPVLVTSQLLEQVRSNLRPVSRDAAWTQTQFIEQAQAWFLGTRLNHISGLDAFPFVKATMGCNHALDDLMIQHGAVGELQVLAGEYGYYRRLDPALVVATPGSLVPGLPLVISMPFVGVMDVHPQMADILDECDVKGIPVHIDGAWMSAARDIEFDFDHPVIASVAMSLSKGMDLWWNRVGLRWSRTELPNSSISIYNQFYMIPQACLDIGLTYLQSIPPDHLWNCHGVRYNELCRTLYLRPTKMIHLARSIDRTHTYALRHLLEP